MKVAQILPPEVYHISVLLTWSNWSIQDEKWQVKPPE